MPVQIGSQPLADFNRPIELLKDCHRRVEHFLNVLITVTGDLRGRTLDDEHRRALETALNYFRTGSPRHTQDEEQSLFPRMRECPDPGVREAMSKIDALEADHVQANAIHTRIEALGQRWLDDNKLAADHAEVLFEDLVRLRDLYERHIHVEDHVVFPLAAAALRAEQLAVIGGEMAARRATDPGRPGSRCAQRRLEKSTGQIQPPTCT